MSEEAEGERRAQALDRARLARAVRGRLRFVLMLAAVGVLIGAAGFFLWPRTYKATSSVRYEGHGDDVDREVGVAAQAMLMEEQVEKARMLLQEPERLHDVFTIDKAGPLLKLYALGPSPSRATARADAVVTVFLADQAEKAQRRRLEALEVAERDERETQQALGDVRAELDQFRAETGVADLPQERQHAIEAAADLRVRAIQEDISAKTEQARFEALREATSELPELIVARAAVESSAQGNLDQARTDLRNAEATLADEHPRVQALRARVAQLEAAPEVSRNHVQSNPARNQLRRARNQAEQAADAAQQRATSLQALAEQAAERARSLNELEGRASVLMARLELAEQAHEEAQVRVSALRDGAGHTDFVWASAASLPEHPEKSFAPWLFGALAPLLLTLFGALIAIGFDYRRLEMITAREVAWWGGGPVIGVSVWPRDAHGLDALVDELQDLASESLGRTLVVPASEDERHLACAFAGRLAEAPWFSAGILDVEEEEAEEKDEGPIVTPPPKRLSSVPPPAPAEPPSDEGRRVRRATLRMIVKSPTEGGTTDIERAFAAVELGGATSSSYSGNESVVITAPAFIIGAPSEVPKAPSVVVANTVRVEGRPSVNAPSALLQQAARKLLQSVEESDYRSRPPASGPEQRGVGIAWNGPLSGPALRRAARLSDRVIVVVRGGARTGLELRSVMPRLGRFDNVGFIVVDVPPDLAEIDRVGNVQAFWQGQTPKSERPPVQRPMTVNA